MRLSILFIAISCLSFFAKAQESKPVIVVELFTSEGCSSCPPADQLLSRIVNTDYGDLEVLGLSFHVNYWDYIGWKDPYASQSYTNRQRAYARKFGLKTIYTPQMIVNGKHEFVGSSRVEWIKSLDEEKGNIQEADLTIDIIEKTSETLLISVKSKAIANAQVNVAIVERNLFQDVESGENRGRRLAHDNVVRSFTTRSFDGKENRFKLNLPEDLVMENSSLIVYVQSGESWRILEAKQIDLSVSQD